MKTTMVGVFVILLGAGGVRAQGPEDIRAVSADIFAVLTGDIERFERGMGVVEALAAKNPDDARIKVLYGNGLLARAGAAFEKGDAQHAMKVFQSGLEEMAKAVAMAPEDVFVRARRGVILITSSRQMPPAMGGPLTRLAVEDFEKVLETRDRTQTLSRGSAHQRGELLIGLADGWNRLGDLDKARGYFERVTRELQGTIYDQRAKAWLEGKPEARSPGYFACSGCHVE
jgi:tetratricopeptide (TPR) repeat protein